MNAIEVEVRSPILLFLLYPIIELIGLIIAGRILGIGLTLFIILATGILGVLVLRLAGLTTVIGIKQRLAQGEAPNKEMINGMLLGFGGILLFLPGLLGDIVGILLIIPFTRQLFIRYAKKTLMNYNVRMQQNFSDEKFSEREASHKPNIIEGEWERRDK